MDGCWKPQIDASVKGKSEDAKELYFKDLDLILCRCDDCLRLYELQGLDFMLRTEVSSNLSMLEVDEIDDSIVLDDRFNIEKLGIKALENLPRGKAIDVMGQFEEFMKSITSNLHERIDKEGRNTVTEEDIRMVVEKTKNSLKKRSRTEYEN